MPNVFGEKNVSDIQVFEYTDTLSIKVPDAYKNGKVGDIVIFGGKAGILVSDVAQPIEDQIKAVQASGDPRTKPTYGLNKPGYASVRITGGAFKLDVKNSGAKNAGTTVYAKLEGDKAEATTTASGGTRLGFLAHPIDGDAKAAVVVLD